MAIYAKIIIMGAFYPPHLLKLLKMRCSVYLMARLEFADVRRQTFSEGRMFKRGKIILKK